MDTYTQANNLKVRLLMYHSGELYKETNNLRCLSSPTLIWFDFYLISSLLEDEYHATLSLGNILYLGIFAAELKDPVTSEGQHIYYGHITSGDRISNISCLLNGTTVVEAFVFTWENITLQSFEDQVTWLLLSFTYLSFCSDDPFIYAHLLNTW